MSDRNYQMLLNSIDEEEVESSFPSECDDLLHAYIDLELSGTNPVEAYPNVKNCIDTNLEFRQAYEELKAILRLEKSGGLIEPVDEIVIEEGFIDSLITQSKAIDKVEQFQVKWHISNLGHLIVKMTAHLIDSAQQAISESQSTTSRSMLLAGQLRGSGDKLPQFSLKGAIDDLDVMIESKEEGNNSQTCLITVKVDIPSKGGWPNLGNIPITLSRDIEEIETQLTDAYGIAIFRHISIHDLGNLIFEIAPLI